MSESNLPGSAAPVANGSNHANGAARPVVLSLHIKERSSLQAAYMPFLHNGGLFLAGAKGYQMGDDIYLQLTLPEDTQKYPIAGKVAWLTPAGAVNNRAQGIGIHFRRKARRGSPGRGLKHCCRSTTGNPSRSYLVVSVFFFLYFSLTSHATDLHPPHRAPARSGRHR